MQKKAWRVCFPIDAVDVPAAAAFDALRKGALISIAHTYWRGDCDDSALPDTDDGWQAIAGASSMGWHRIKDRVLIAFDQAKPLIRDARKAAKMTSENGKNAGRASMEQRAQKSRAKLLETQISDSLSRAVPFLPVKAPSESFGHHGHANNGQQIPYRAARGLEGGLVDKPKKT